MLNALKKRNEFDYVGKKKNEERERWRREKNIRMLLLLLTFESICSNDDSKDVTVQSQFPDKFIFRFLFAEVFAFLFFSTSSAAATGWVRERESRTKEKDSFRLPNDEYVTSKISH